MSTDDIKHGAEDLAGKAKEGLGKVTGNDNLKAEGKADQVKSSVEKGLDDAKEFLDEAKDSVVGEVKKIADKLKNN